MSVVRTGPAVYRRTSGLGWALPTSSILPGSALLDDGQALRRRGRSVGHEGVAMGGRTERRRLWLDGTRARALGREKGLIVHFHRWRTSAPPRRLFAAPGSGALSRARDPVRAPTFGRGVVGAYVRVLRPPTAVVADRFRAVTANFPVATGIANQKTIRISAVSSGLRHSPLDASDVYACTRLALSGQRLVGGQFQPWLFSP